MQDLDSNFINNTADLTEHRNSRNELTPLYSSNPVNGTLRLLVTFFSVFTAVVSVALALQLYYGAPQMIRYGDVSSASEICSKKGELIIKQGGNAVDAAIATAFCVSVTYAHITGIGGGGLMLIYNQRERKVLDSIDFRVTRSKNNQTGVPGFVAGLALAHHLYGLLPWSTLIQPAINIARDGFPLPAHKVESGAVVFTGKKKQNWLKSVKPNEIIKLPKLADLLSIIANSTSDEFYKGTLKAQLTIYDLNENDVANYTAIRGPVVEEKYNGFKLVIPSKGTGGPSVINFLKNANKNAVNNENDDENIHAMFSSSIIAFDSDDMYVSLVSGLGSLFGSQIVTPSGYILNDFLEYTDDLNSRPSVSILPVIAVESGRRVCGFRFALGSSNINELNRILFGLLNNVKNNSTKTHLIREDEISSRMHTIQVLSRYSDINIIEKYSDTVTGYSHIVETFNNQHFDNYKS